MGGGVSPLSAAVLDVGFPQQGKSRLTAYISSTVALADTYIAQLAQEKLSESREDGQAYLPAALTVHSIGMQSVTMPEFFYWCSPDWPQTEEAQMLHHRDIPSRACRSMILNMDEGYEFLGALSVNAGGAAAGSKDTGPCAHASTLNTPLGTGKLQRSTRSSGSYGSSNSAIVNLDLLENLHPEMLIKIERGLVGNHVHATKERFLFSEGRACKRHDALPDGFRLPAGVNSRWTRVWPRALAGTSMTSPHTPPQITSNHTHCKRTTFTNIQESDNVGPAGGYIISSRDRVSLRIRYVQVDGHVKTEYRISARWQLVACTTQTKSAAPLQGAPVCYDSIRGICPCAASRRAV